MYVRTYIPLGTSINDVATEKDAQRRNPQSALHLIHEPPHGQNPNQEPQAVTSKQHASMHPRFMLPCKIQYAASKKQRSTLFFICPLVMFGCCFTLWVQFFKYV